MNKQNKANGGRTQIPDISLAGKELSEEHLGIVAGGFPSCELTFLPHKTYTCHATCTGGYDVNGNCRPAVKDSYESDACYK